MVIEVTLAAQAGCANQIIGPIFKSRRCFEFVTSTFLPMPPAPIARIEVVRTHLELPSRAALCPAREPAEPQEPVQLSRAAGIAAEDYLELYRSVGGRWQWTDRLLWSGAELEAYLASPNMHLWLLRAGDAVAGYFELQTHVDGHAEIMYFGLVPEFIGRGLGGWMLTRACEESFALGASRVILNTCTLDAPQALPNYIARGFRIVREERYTVDA